MTIELPQEVIRKLKATAEKLCWGDALYAEDTDTCVEGYAGGNVDDAFEGGERTGRVALARELCDKLGITFISPQR